MTKQEFLRQLSDKLSEELNPTDVMREARYYEGYIDGEMARGKTEEEAIRDLGSPVLIARNILESPHEEESEEISLFQDEGQEAYEEGAYQGENQLSESEIKASIHAEQSDLKREGSGEEKDPSGDNPLKSGDREERSDESPENDGQSRESADDHEVHRKKTQEATDYGTSGHTASASGERKHETGWDLFSMILTLLIGVTAIIYLVKNAIMSPDHPLWIVMLIALAVFLVLFIRGFKSGAGPHDKETK